MSDSQFLEGQLKASVFADMANKKQILFVEPSLSLKYRTVEIGPLASAYAPPRSRRSEIEKTIASAYAPTAKPSKQGTDDSETPSNNLWVGNLASDVTDFELMDLFAQYGALDSVTTYSSRSATASCSSSVWRTLRRPRSHCKAPFCVETPLRLSLLDRLKFKNLCMSTEEEGAQGLDSASAPPGSWTQR
ncbi:hypothetical protein ACE6H2_004338 [Prunus campanulata]